jgi:hypothetical protein
VGQLQIKVVHVEWQVQLYHVSQSTWAASPRLELSSPLLLEALRQLK